MHDDFRIGRTDAIDYTHLKFFVKQRPLPDVDADSHLRSTHVIQCFANIRLLLLNKLLEVHIDLALAGRRVQRLLMGLLLLHGLHLGSPFFSLLFNFLYAFHFEFNLVFDENKCYNYA